MKSDAFPRWKPSGPAIPTSSSPSPIRKTRSPSRTSAASAQFLRRAAATGKVIDTAVDRKQVQGLLDYWSATLYSQGHRQPGGSADVERLPREETVLTEFETGTVNKVAQAADAWFRKLTDGDRDLVRRILLRLVRLPCEGRKLQPIVVTRSTLQQLGSPTRVDAILEGLAEAGVIRVEKAAQPEDDQISLRFDALTRSWKEYAGWVDRRVRFRDAASFWVASGRDRAALIRDELLDEAMDFHDKNELEQGFIAASRDRERSQNRRISSPSGSSPRWRPAPWCSPKWPGPSGHGPTRRRGMRTSRNSSRRMRPKVVEIQEQAARRAEAALKAKFKLTNMVSVTRTLAEIATAVSDGERQIAARRLEILADNLSKDPDFAPIFQQVADSLARVKKGAASHDDHRSIALKALEIGRKLKADAIQVQDPNLLTELKAQRIVSYQMARFCGQQIVETFKTQSFVDADPYIKEFKLLYWGELGIVEQDAVQEAMSLFGRKLREIDRKIESQLPDPKTAPRAQAAGAIPVAAAPREVQHAPLGEPEGPQSVRLPRQSDEPSGPGAGRQGTGSDPGAEADPGPRG